MVDGSYPFFKYNCDDDVWDSIDLVIKDTERVNEEEGKSFSITESVMAQLPFFACVNIVIDAKMNRDISKYIYCTELGVSPYPGTFGQQPKKWVEKFFAIKSTLAKYKIKD
jgi:hypothetical protein